MNRKARTAENICKIYLAKYMYEEHKGYINKAYKLIIKRNITYLKMGPKFEEIRMS